MYAHPSEMMVLLSSASVVDEVDIFSALML